MVGLRDIIDIVKLNNIKKKNKKKPLFVRNVMARMELEHSD
jgi:phosphopantetheinyl transferase (holo-ACP synthase)